MTAKIKELPSEERPRERLLKNGVSALSNEELIALLIKSGSRAESAKEISRNLLSSYQNIQQFGEITYEQLINVKGIGQSKACSIISAIELGKRVYSTVPTLENIKLNSASLIFEYYKNNLKNKKQEHFYCLYVDSKKCFLKETLLFVGTLNYSMVHPREIFKEAYLANASGIICIHNHPSGNINPSREDITLTDRLKQVGLLFGIPILDHIIIGNDTYYSFFENDKI